MEGVMDNKDKNKVSKQKQNSLMNIFLIIGIILILFFIGFFILQNYAPGAIKSIIPSAKLDWQTADNSQFNYTIQYPQDWKLSQKQGIFELTKYDQSSKNALAGVTIEVVDKNGITIDQYARRTFTNLDKYAVSDTTVSKYQGKEYTYQGEKDKPNSLIAQKFVEKNNKFYIFYLATENKNDNMDTINNILNSFKLK